MLDPDPAARPDAGAVMAKVARESTTGAAATSAETQVMPAASHRAERRPDRDRAPNGLLRQPVMWSLVAIATLVALAAIVIGSELSPGPSSTSSSDADTAAAVEDGNATTTAPPPTAPAPTTTVPSATTVPTTVAAPSCADIDARKELLEDQKQQLDVVYPDDKDLRDQVKRQIEDEKRALDDDGRALGC
jgi:hypothetical protein